MPLGRSVPRRCASCYLREMVCLWDGTILSQPRSLKRTNGSKEVQKSRATSTSLDSRVHTEHPHQQGPSSKQRVPRCCQKEARPTVGGGDVSGHPWAGAPGSVSWETWCGSGSGRPGSCVVSNKAQGLPWERAALS